MSSLLSPVRGTTIFHVPIGDGLEEPVAIANDRIDRSIVAPRGEPLIGHPEYKDAVEKLMSADRWKSRRIFVTSPGESDGKTRTAFNLAAALASRERSVLLAEINFTRPRFKALLGELRFRYGIDTAVSGEATPAETVIGVGETGLHLAAVRRPVPKDGLERSLSRLHDFFHWANDNYQLLVLDCPAVVSPEWHHWFHAFIGEALLVVREHRTPMADLREAIRLLDNHLVAAWFNRETQEDLELAHSNRTPITDTHGQIADYESTKGARASYTPWSRETMRAVSLLMAYGSSETNSEVEPGLKNETDLPSTAANKNT